MGYANQATDAVVMTGAGIALDPERTKSRFSAAGTADDRTRKCCQCENVASSQFQFPMDGMPGADAKLATGNIGNWQHFHTGNILPVFAPWVPLW